MNSRAMVFGRWLMLSIGIACLAGCGIKTRPRAPEDVRPEQILDLRATSVADGIQLAWTRPDRYQNRDQMRDLNDFLILRAADNAPMKELSKVPVTDQQRFQQQHHMLLVDKDALMNHRYRYQVISQTSDGYQSLPSNEVTLVRTLPPVVPGAGHLSQHAPGASSQESGTAAHAP